MADAAIRIQAFFRGCMQQKAYRHLQTLRITAVIKIQATVRMFLCTRDYLTLRRAVINMQALARESSQHRKFRELLLRKRFVARQLALQQERAAGAKIVSVFQMVVQRQKFKNTVKKIILVQSLVRGFLARKAFCMKQQTWVLALCTRAYHVFAFVRRFRAGNTIATWYHSCRMQRRVRVECLAEASRLAFAAEHAASVARESLRQNSAIVIQSVTRCFLARCHLAHLRSVKQRITAVVKIQTCVRLFFARRSFLKIRAAAVLFQTKWRVVLVLRNEIRLRLLEKNRVQCERTAAVLVIASAWKSYQIRKDFRSKRLQIILLQARARGWLQRRSFTRRITAVRVIQNGVRGFLARLARERLIQRRVSACTIIQTYTRGYLARCSFRVKKEQYTSRIASFRTAAKVFLAAVKIQRYVRAYHCRSKKIHAVQAIAVVVCARAVQRTFTQLRSSIICLQYRIRRMVRLQDRTKFERGAIKIQAVFRGYMVRRGAGKKLQAIHKKLVIINTTVQEHMKLGNRTRY